MHYLESNQNTPYLENVQPHPAQFEPVPFHPNDPLTWENTPFPMDYAQLNQTPISRHYAFPPTLDDSQKNLAEVLAAALNKNYLSFCSENLGSSESESVENHGSFIPLDALMEEAANQEGVFSNHSSSEDLYLLNLLFNESSNHSGMTSNVSFNTNPPYSFVDLGSNDSSNQSNPFSSINPFLNSPAASSPSSPDSSDSMESESEEVEQKRSRETEQSPETKKALKKRKIIIETLTKENESLKKIVSECLQANQRLLEGLMDIDDLSSESP